MCPVIIKNHSETDNSHPIFVVSGIKDTPYGTRIVQFSHCLHPVDAEFLIIRLNLTNTTAEHAYPHLIVMCTLYRAYFIVGQFSYLTTRQIIFERIEIILIMHDTQTATGAHPYTMQLVLLDSIYDIVIQCILLAFYPMKTVVLHTSCRIRCFQLHKPSVPSSNPNLLLVVLKYYIGKIQNRIKIGIKFIPPRIVTVKTAFTSCYPNVPLRIFHYGRNSSQPPARQINPLKYILRFSLSEKSPVAAYPNIPVPCTKDIRRVQRFQFFTSDTLYLSGKLMQLEYSFFRSNP